MSRTLIAVLVVGIGSLALPAIATPSAGLLDEMVPWPMLSAAIPMRRLILEDQPIEHFAGFPCPSSDAGGPLYGLIPLGDGSDPGISIVVWLGDEIRLIVDTDNDEDLADETGLYSRERIMARAFTWYVTVSLEYENEAAPAEYALAITGAYSHGSGSYDFLYGGFCHRRGVLDIDGVVVPIAITSQISTGHYDDLSSLLVSVDTDGDGTLDTLPGSHEVFPPGEPLQIGSRVFRIDSVSPSGRRIVLEEIGEAPPRLSIQRGDFTPDFGGETVDGQTVRLFDFRGRVVVLILEAASSAGCPSCVSITSSGAQRTTSVCDALRYLRDDVIILSVRPGSPPSESHVASRDADDPVTIYSDEAFAVYRRRTGLFVLDREMVIVELDEAWSTIRCDRPVGILDLLNEFELRQSIERLLAEEAQGPG